MGNVKLNYVVEYADGKNTSTGTPNPNTGRYSIACTLYVFSSKKTAIDFADKYDMGIVTKKRARELHAGSSVAIFEEHINLRLDENLPDV